MKIWILLSIFLPTCRIIPKFDPFYKRIYHHAIVPLHKQKKDREAEQLHKLQNINLEAKYAGDIFKVRDRPHDRVGYLPEVLQEKVSD